MKRLRLQAELKKVSEERDEWKHVATHLEMEKRGILPKDAPATDLVVNEYALVHYDQPIS